jgi:ADP-ribose pyrophosphatase
VINLRVDEVELSDGQIRRREIVEHRGAIAAVPLTDEGDVILVRQFRPAAGRDLLEIPAGTLEPGEEIASALQRELAEEIGMQARTVEHLCNFFPSPGFLTEELHVFLARKLYPHRLPAEEDDLVVLRLPLREALALVARGEIQDSKSIIGLLQTASRLSPR